MLRRRLAALLLLALLAGCATTDSGITRGVILVPQSWEVSLGRQVAEKVEAEYGRLEDEGINAYLGEVGARLVAVCDRRDLSYTFRALDTPEVNAFAAPGGFIFVTRGLLERCDDEAELASVMAHEIGHVCAFHSVKRLQTALGYTVAASIIYYNSDSEYRDEIAQYADIAFQLMLLGYSRGDEYQADQLGLYYSAHAGYDPFRMEVFFRKLLEEHGETPRFLVWLATHPAMSDRIERVPAVVAKYHLAQNATPEVGAERYQRNVRARLDGNLEYAVRDTFRLLLDAFRREDLDAFMELVGDDYRGADGETRDGLRQRQAQFFARAADIRIAPGKTGVTFSGNRAELSYDYTLTYTGAGTAREVKGSELLTFRRETADAKDDRWLLVGARQ